MSAWLRREIARAPALYGGLVLAALSFGAYANTLRAGFHYDDSHHIVANPFIRDLSYVPGYFSRADTFSALPGHSMYRPLVMLSLALNYHWGGYDPLPWRLTALALHAVCAVGVYLTLRHLATRWNARPARTPEWGPFVAALLFALHPVYTETVDYASARSSLMATTFCVWAFLSHQSAVVARRRGARIALEACALVLFGGGLLSKESAIVFPALLLAAAFLGRRGYAAVIPSVLVACLFLYVRKVVLGTAVVDFSARATAIAAADPGTGGARPILWNLWTQSRVLLAYVSLFLLPVGLSVDRFVRVSTTPFEPGVIAGIALAAGLLFAAWRLRERAPLASLGLLWFLLGLAPTSSIIPLNVIMGEHRLYLPGAGVAMLVAAWPLRPRFRAAAALAALPLLALTLHRNLDWNDGERLWSSAVAVSPRSAGAWNSLGVVHCDRGRLDEALADFGRALDLDPSNWNAAFNLGTTHLRRGRETGNYDELEEAKRWLEKSRQIRPDATRSDWYLAETLWEMGRHEQAEQAFLRLAGLSPRLFEMTRYPLARLALERKDYAAAEARYREALRDGTDPVSAHLGLARLREERGDRAGARSEAVRAREARPHDPQPFVYLARLEPGTPQSVQSLFEAERRGYRPTPEERAALLGRRRP